MPIADWLPYPSPLYINIGIGLSVSRIHYELTIYFANIVQVRVNGPYRWKIEKVKIKGFAHTPLFLSPPVPEWPIQFQFREYTQNLLSVSRIHYGSIILFRELTLNSLSVSCIHHFFHQIVCIVLTCTLIQSFFHIILL